MLASEVFNWVDFGNYSQTLSYKEFIVCVASDLVGYRYDVYVGDIEEVKFLCELWKQILNSPRENAVGVAVKMGWISAENCGVTHDTVYEFYRELSQTDDYVDLYVYIEPGMVDDRWRWFLYGKKSCSGISSHA